MVMKVYILYQDQDNSCGDPDCCGGPHPYPSAKIFSSKEAAKEVGGLTGEELKHLVEVEVDTNEFVSID
jgi:hypothetical protein